VFKRISSTVSPLLPPAAGIGLFAIKVAKDVLLYIGLTAFIPAVELITVISFAGTLVQIVIL